MTHADRRIPLPQRHARESLPRALVGRLPTFLETWKFEMNELVDWDGEQWTVKGRSRSYAGREIYEVYRPSDDRPVRFIDGSMLSHPAMPVPLAA